MRDSRQKSSRRLEVLCISVRHGYTQKSNYGGQDHAMVQKYFNWSEVYEKTKMKNKPGCLFHQGILRTVFI